MRMQITQTTTQEAEGDLRGAFSNAKDIKIYSKNLTTITSGHSGNGVELIMMEGEVEILTDHFIEQKT